MQTQYCSDRPFKISLGSRDNWEDGKIPDHRLNYFIWYTDGSRKEPQCGAGIYREHPRMNTCISLRRYCIVFQAEVFAILTCAYRGLERGYKVKNILILSDSQSALKALESYEVSSKLVWECLQTLQTLTSFEDTSYDSSALRAL